jgi:hypothetical protein
MLEKIIQTNGGIILKFGLFLLDSSGYIDGKLCG